MQTQPFTMTVPCRKCEPCLRYRAWQWAERAKTELRTASRTWFATLTLSPERQTWARMSARHSLHGAVSDITEQNLFKATVDAVSPELQRWLKRVRKVSGARLRYLLVCEAHKSGLPHWHLLIHENAGTVTERMLRLNWTYGHSKFKLVDRTDQKVAWYLCKYVAKSALVKVRASVKYGDFMSAATEARAPTPELLRDCKGKGKGV